MKRLLALLFLFAFNLAHAQAPVDLGDDPARELAARAAKLPRGEHLPEADARVAKTRGWLKQVARATGEGEDVIAATSVKLARYLWEVARVEATPLETLEGLALNIRAGVPTSEVTQRYFRARLDSPNKSHAEALARMAGAK